MDSSSVLNICHRPSRPTVHYFAPCLCFWGRGRTDLCGRGKSCSSAPGFSKWEKTSCGWAAAPVLLPLWGDPLLDPSPGLAAARQVTVPANYKLMSTFLGNNQQQSSWELSELLPKVAREDENRARYSSYSLFEERSGESYSMCEVG